MDELGQQGNQSRPNRWATWHRWAWRCAWVFLIAMLAAWVAPRDFGGGFLTIGPTKAPLLTVCYLGAILASWATSGRVLWLPSWRVVHRTALALAALFAVVTVVAIFAPGSWQIGRINLAVRSWTKPVMWLTVAATVAVVTGPGSRAQCAAVCRAALGFPRAMSRLKMASVTFGLILGWQALLAGQSLLHYPTTTADWFAMFDDSRHDDVFHDERRPNFECFCAIIARQTPPDARILYHGHCLTITDKLYPRRVFMLPQEQFAMFRESVLNLGWGRRREDDPLDRQWTKDAPPARVNREEFIRRHRITHEVTFDETAWSGCRVEAVR